MTSTPSPRLLREVASFGSGTTPSRSRFADYYESGTIPWVKTLDLNNGPVVRTDERITRFAVAETGITIHPEGSVLVAMYGGFQQIGRTGLLTFPAATNQAITTIIPDPRCLIGSYLLHVLNLRVHDWRHVAISSRKDPNITKEDVKKFALVVPSLAQQHAIAESLDDADGLITALERTIVKKVAIKQGMMQQLLTGKIRLPGFTAAWNSLPFSEVAYRVNAKRYQVPASSYGEVGRLPVVDQGQKAIVGYTDDIEAEFDPGSEGVVVFGDHTCITKFVDFKFAVGADGTQIVKAKTGNSTRFMAYALEAAPLASTGYNRHFKFLREKALPVPGLDEQIAIVNVLRDTDSALAALRRRLSKARCVKQGMMQELLSGRTRLPVEDRAA